MKHKYRNEDIIFRPISITKITCDRLLAEDHPVGIMALYMFYYYTKVWQEKQYPWMKDIKSTTSFAARGLNVSEEKVRKWKKKLVELGLIEDIVSRDENGKIQGHFIRVKYTLEDHPTDFPEYGKLDESLSHPTDFPEGGKTHSMGNEGANTTITNIKIQKGYLNKMPAGQAGRANFENSSFSDEEETIEQPIKKEKKKSIKEEPTLASLSQKTTLLGTKQKEMTFHQKCAKKLIETVHQVFHSNNSTSFANWAKEFEKLERINQIEPERIDKVLSYFCEELKEKKKQGKGSVLSYSAGQFRKNFIMIEQFMEQKEDRVPKKVKLDDEGEKVLKEIGALVWPNGAAARLPEAIQRSQDRLTVFWKLNDALVSSIPKDARARCFDLDVRLGTFARRIKNKCFSRLGRLKYHFKCVHEKVKNWKNWNGRFDSYILDYKNPVFQETVLRPHMIERCGKDEAFLFPEYIKSLEELEGKADNNE